MWKEHIERRRAGSDVSDNGLFQKPTRFVEVYHRPEPADPVPVQPVIQGPVCGNCKEAGHQVTGCANVREDGFVHGCSICNSGDHYTHQCTLFDTALEKQVQVLVQNRANLPPLAGRSWYPVMYAYILESPLAAAAIAVEGLPWTVSFSKRVRSGERRDVVMDIMGSPPRDPRTGSWVAAKRTYGKLASIPNKLQAACVWPEISPFYTQYTIANQTSPDIDAALATTMPKEQYQHKIQAKPKSGLTLVDSMVLQTVKHPDSTRPPGLSTHSNSGGGGTQLNIFTQVNETQKTIALKVNNEDSWREAYRIVSAMNPSAPVGAVVFNVMPKDLEKRR
ncbi:hypothetical protein NM208_g3798 [Fusarium decemcellulare]|uniref:Uncharacterized protein n=1 Tax=Fusarium decemcellulare TaxID=57161 RepID=A0ACC1SN53_9HYPO|nr:hypothetical protein NM208_g3798 [Fusarium decemcellulare]